MTDVENLVERLRQIAESQRMDFDSPNVAATLDDAATTLEALARIGSVVPEEPEWEYGVTTKWGIHEHPHLEGAERYAAAVRDEVERGRASGDLAHHGRVMRRTKAKAGPWEPIEQGGE